MERAWTVYCITCSEDGRLYIGVTSRSLAHRWSGHRGEARRKSRAKGPLQIAMRRFGIAAFSIRPLHEGVDRSTALALERRLIAEHGTLWPGGYNGTNGGDIGLEHSPATLAKMSAALRGKKKTPEQRARMSEAQKNRSTELQERMNAAIRGKKRTPEQIERMRIASFKKNTEEVKAKIRATLKGRHTVSSEACARGAAKRRGQKRSAETRAKMSASQKRRFANPESQP